MSIATQPREIQILIFRYLDETDLVQVSETCHSLKEVARDPYLWKKLTLTYAKIKTKTEACRNHVSRCSKLREIFIIGEEEEIVSSVKIMAVVMKAKATLKLLSINLGGSHACLSNSSFEKIGASMTQLTQLDVNGGKLRRGGIASLSRLKELKSLKLPGLLRGDNLVQDGLPTPMASLEDLFSKLKKLEEVELQSCGHYPNDEVVESLVNNNPNLHHLDISSSVPVEASLGMGELTSRSLILIADKCPQLTHIGFANQDTFSSSSITRLVSKCIKLKHVNFRNTNVDETALVVMSKSCPVLEYLNVVGCLGIHAGLERLVNLASAPNLKQLYLSEWYYDSDWDFLEKMKKDLPSLKIVMEKELHDEDDSYDSEDSTYDSSSMFNLSMINMW